MTLRTDYVNATLLEDLHPAAHNDTNARINALEARLPALEHAARTLDAIEARATGLELAVGVPTFDRANISAVLPLVNQRVFMSYIAPPANMTCARIRTYSGTTAAATPTGIYLGVYREETNGDLTLLGQTANGAGTIYTAPDTAYEPVLQTSVALIAGKRYALAVLVAAIGMPSVPATVNNVPQNLEDLRFPYRSARTSSAVTTLPATVSVSGFFNAAIVYLVALP